MNVLFRHIKAFAFLLSFAIIFVNTAGAVGMVSMQHGTPGPDSSQSMHAQMVANTDGATDPTHMHGNAHAASMESHSDGMDESNCASICAAHCISTVFYQSPPLTAHTLVTKTARLPSQALNAVMVSGLYKPPRPLH